MSPGKTVQPQKISAARAGAGTAKREPAPRARPTQTTRKSGNGKRQVGPEERYRMIAIAAYHRAEKRGFEGGSPEQDWLEAEAEIDQALATARH